MRHSLSDTHFESIEDIRNFVYDFIASKPPFIVVESDNCSTDCVRSSMLTKNISINQSIHVNEK
ncbi:hypothetical protein ALC60_12801 [Trachymyrmex zeteki]|uniref:Uncharacterized protein n=1 Tax=Mycetomoellerius zeteki TaxID=64791 RepID=A0A151WJW4_9HYME|nr:hypothetical protein ALC60_12801 [Trachymyrmex zeteki]